MDGNAVLRACMLGLVLVNLVFVQLTGAAGLEWLGPLYALTIFAPLLAPLREKFVYRQLWNAGVLGVFAVLVRHASGYDLRYVLQDGLVLAALCQVHLLNNLRSEQRPDLLFWNSFVIAVATGYLSQHLVYPFAFLVYVPLYVIGLQLLCVTRRQRELAPEPTRLIVRDGLARSSVLLVLTLAVFLFWPRDFHRPSLLTGEFDFSAASDTIEIAFTDTMELAKSDRAKASNRVVMTVTLQRGSPASVPSLWRGATLASTDGKGWWPLAGGDFARGTGDDPWRRRGREFTRGPERSASGALLSVKNVDPAANRLFAPLVAERLRLGEGADPGRVVTRPDATLQYDKPKFVRPTVPYKITLGVDDATRREGRTPEELDRGISRYVALPRSRHVQAARELAEKLASRQPRDFAQHALVSSFSDYVETRYTYLPPGAAGSAGTLEQFLEGDAGGHCEYFASALATMLRSRGVPCRVVTGYRSNEWDGAGRVLTFRRRHAHAWVEVFDPAAGWYSVDPNPTSSLGYGPSLWRQVHASLSKAWGVLAGFDAARRDAVLAWALNLPSRAWLRARANPEITFAVVGLGLCIPWLGGIRRRKAVPSVRVYHRALHRAGLRLDAGETPRELLDRARATGVTSERLAALSEATRLHERARYAA